MDDFRFEKLDIWKESIDISDLLFDYADKADNKKTLQVCWTIKSCWNEYLKTTLLKDQDRFQIKSLLIFWIYPEGLFLNVLILYTFSKEEK